MTQTFHTMTTRQDVLLWTEHLVTTNTASACAKRFPSASCSGACSVSVWASTNVDLKRMCSGGGDDGYSASHWLNREDPWLPAGARLLLIAASAATHIALREAAQRDLGVLKKSAELQ